MKDVKFLKLNKNTMVIALLELGLKDIEYVRDRFIDECSFGTVKINRTDIFEDEVSSIHRLALLYVDANTIIPPTIRDQVTNIVNYIIRNPIADDEPEDPNASEGESSGGQTIDSNDLAAVWAMLATNDSDFVVKTNSSSDGYVIQIPKDVQETLNFLADEYIRINGENSQIWKIISVIEDSEDSDYVLITLEPAVVTSDDLPLSIDTVERNTNSNFDEDFMKQITPSWKLIQLNGETAEFSTSDNSVNFSTTIYDNYSSLLTTGAYVRLNPRTSVKNDAKYVYELATVYSSYPGSGNAKMVLSKLSEAQTFPTSYVQMEVNVNSSYDPRTDPNFKTTE